jgi:hypothetical protein
VTDPKRTNQDSPLPVLCHKIRHITGAMYPILRERIVKASRMGTPDIQASISMELEDLDACFVSIESSLGDYCKESGGE